MKAVYLEWRDSTQHARWHPPDGFKNEKGVTVKSIGYIVEENKDVVVLAGNISGETNEVSSITVIPKSAIVKRRIVRRKK